MIASPSGSCYFLFGSGYSNTFDSWSLEGLCLQSGNLFLDTATAREEHDPYPLGGYYGHNYYNGGRYLVGEAVSPILNVDGAQQAIVSWNIETPAGTWIEVLLKVRLNEQWMHPVSMGVWSSDIAFASHSVPFEDQYLRVDTDVLKLKTPYKADALQIIVRLFSTSTDSPCLKSVMLTLSGSSSVSGYTSASRTCVERVLDVPLCSQMVYPNGGNVWCSPTCIAMLLGYWGIGGQNCSDRVRDAVQGVFDWMYGGYGNWSFNVAYAASKGLEAYLVRMRSLADAERWIEIGVPLAISYAWGKGELTGAPIESSDGHIVVLAGFDSNGDPVINDPAASSDEAVRRTYKRDEVEGLWLGHSYGTTYVIFPSDHRLARRLIEEASLMRS